MDAARQKKSVMVAVLPETAASLIPALEAHYELHWPKSVVQAQLMLERVPIDLIICGVLFDDSRMLDLLQYCKYSERLASIPFVGIRVRRGRLPVDSFRDLKLASSALGGAGFIDFEQWQRTLGTQEAQQKLQQMLDDLLEGGASPLI